MMSFPPYLVEFLTGSFSYATELQALGMALQGAVAVKSGLNKDGKMHWFHAFALTTIVAFGGGWLGFMLMGKPTSMITGGDINVGSCIIAFLVVNYTPFDIGFQLLNFLPVKIVVTAFAQLFRSSGMIRFIKTATSEIQPSPYYPTPLLGPIVYGTMLGNMSGFMLKGFDGYLGGGMPWPFQNGLFIGTFFHIFAHDEKGFLGTTLRGVFKSMGSETLLGGLDDVTFAHVITAGFMQLAGIMMLPNFLGPTFNPIVDPPAWVGIYIAAVLRVEEPEEVESSPPKKEMDNEIQGNGSKKKRKRKKKVA